MKVHYPKLYNMAHLLALNVLLLPKDLTLIFKSEGAAQIKERFLDFIFRNQNNTTSWEYKRRT